MSDLPTPAADQSKGSDHESGLPRPHAYGVAGGISFNRSEFDAWMANPLPDSNPFELLSAGQALLPSPDTGYHFEDDTPIFTLPDGRTVVMHTGVVNIYDSTPKWIDRLAVTNERLDRELLEGRDPWLSKHLVENLTAASIEDYSAVHNRHIPSDQTTAVAHTLEEQHNFATLSCAYDIFVLKHGLNEDSSFSNGPMAQSHCSEAWKYRRILTALEERLFAVDPIQFAEWAETEGVQL
jgi:hypothetical protein